MYGLQCIYFTVVNYIYGVRYSIGMQQIKYYKNETRKHLPYEVEIPIYKFKHVIPTRYETIEVGTNVKGLTMYAVKSTGFTTLKYEELQAKFKALRYINEEEFLKPIMLVIA